MAAENLFFFTDKKKSQKILKNFKKPNQSDAAPNEVDQLHEGVGQIQAIGQLHSTGGWLNPSLDSQAHKHSQPKRHSQLV